MTVNRDCCLYLTPRLHQHLTVLCKYPFVSILYPARIVIVGFSARGICLFSYLIVEIVAFPLVVIAIAILDTDKQIVTLHIGAIDIAYVATAKHVAIAVGHTFLGSNLTTIDVDTSTAKDVTVAVEVTHTTKVVVASTATKDMAHDMTVIKIDMRNTCLVYFRQLTYFVGNAVSVFRLVSSTTANGCNLTTTEDTVAHKAAIHPDISNINTTVVDIATSKQTATIEQRTILIGGLIVNLLQIAFVNSCLGVVSAISIIDIADIAVVQRQVRRTIDRSTLTTTVGITLDGGNAVVEPCAVLLTDDDMGLTKDIVLDVTCNDVGLCNLLTCLWIGSRCGNTLMLAHAAFPAASIDVTGNTTLDIGIGTGNKVMIEVVLLNTILILHSSAGTGCIEVFFHRAAQQVNIGRAIHVARAS